MSRRPLILVGAVLLVTLSALFVVGQRMLARDREALVARFADERTQGIREAARGIVGEVADIGEDLDLAATLLQSSETTRLAERELHAIATIKREYLVMYARDPDGDTTKVTAYGTSSDVAAAADATILAMLARAESNPGVVFSSIAYITGPERAVWYRVFARRPTAVGPTVAVLVDMGVLVGRMKLQRDSLMRVTVLDADGHPAPGTDASLAANTTPAILQRLRAGATLDGVSRETIDDESAHRLGLPSARAVLVAVHVPVDGGSPWTLLVAVSTQSLRTQEQSIQRRVLIGSGLVLTLLLSAAAYVSRNAYRAREMRARVRHMEQEAHLTEKAEKILDHIPSGVLALSEERRVTSMNRWLAERLGEEVIGRSLADAFPAGDADDIKLVTELVDTALASRTPQSLHREHITLLSTEATLNIHAVPLARGVGDVSMLIVFDDVTELRRIEERLLHSEKLVTAGQLAAGIAHEVGTPLNVARGRAELSLAHLGDDHQDASNQRVVMDQIDRVTRLLQQLLDYVRPTPIALTDVDLAQSLHVVNELLAPQATKRKVNVSVDASSLPHLRADPDQVQQILVNLTLNAIDACDGGGRVNLRAHADDRSVTLEVVDNGHGIPRELHPQVFDPFFTTKKRGQGTGLGLWVVAQLVRAHNGVIDLDSAPDQGTTIRITWPLPSPQAS